MRQLVIEMSKYESKQRLKQENEEGDKLKTSVFLILFQLPLRHLKIVRCCHRATSSSSFFLVFFLIFVGIHF